MYLLIYLGGITQSLAVPGRPRILVRIAPWHRLVTVDLFQGESVIGKAGVSSEHYFRIRRQALYGSRDEHGKRVGTTFTNHLMYATRSKGPDLIIPAVPLGPGCWPPSLGEPTQGVPAISKLQDGDLPDWET
ncbi:hypothetical protein DFH09DRAFT_1082260 [Mycena vulgaris]|nr:hypothetical protein DFH09DRAFT_1082260 [Mycena vulgaris]